MVRGIPVHQGSTPPISENAMSMRTKTPIAPSRTRAQLYPLRTNQTKVNEIADRTTAVITVIAIRKPEDVMRSTSARGVSAGRSEARWFIMSRRVGYCATAVTILAMTTTIHSSHAIATESGSFGRLFCPSGCADAGSRRGSRKCDIAPA